MTATDNNARKYSPWQWLGGGLILILMVSMIVVSTRQGIGLHSDTVAYFQFARTGHLSDLPTYHAPLLALLVYGGVQAGLSANHAAIVVNALSALVSLVLIWFGYRRHGGATALIMMLLLALSHPFLTNHAWAMSEPLFFAFLIALSLVLLRYCRSPTTVGAAEAGALAALAVLTRYAGLAFFGGGLALLLIRRPLFDRRKIREVTAYAATFALLFAPYYFWNVQRSGSGLHRYFGLNPVTEHIYGAGLVTVCEWFLPYRVFAPFGARPALLLVIGLALGVISATLYALRRQEPMILVPGLLALCYAGMVNVSILFSDMQTPLDHRILAPLYVLLLLLGGGLVATSSRPWGRRIWLFAACYLLLLNAWRSEAFLRQTWREGLGYSASRWQHNELLQLVEQQARRRVFYSNAPDAVQLLTSAETVRWIPFAKNMYNRQPNEHFSEEIAALAREMRQHNAAIVIFRAKHLSDEETPDYLPTAAQLQALTGAAITRENADGVLLEMKEIPEDQR